MKQSGGATRDQIIVRTSVIGILANVLLAGFKAAVGVLTHSIAITLDAVNNLSDAMSSVITIVGTKLAGKRPDAKHPFGHGRIEYLSAILISFLVLYAGVTSLVESGKKILHPEAPSYTVTALIIVAVAVVVKVLLGRYVKRVGEQVDSDALVNSGEDATLDSIISGATVVAAVIYLTLHVSLEAYLGAIIALVIIKAGVEMLWSTTSRLLGEGVDAAFANEIKATICSFPDVQGAYDLVLNDYGPNAYHGSVHIEVPDTYSAGELDELIRDITMKVYGVHHVILTAVGVYSINTKDPEAIAMREAIRTAVLSHPYVTGMHGFYLNREKKTIRFDMVVSFSAPDQDQLYGAVLEELQHTYQEYTFSVAVDTNFAEVQ